MTDAPRPRLVLVDGSGYIFRAFFALPPLTAPDGSPVGAVYGFCNMLWKLLQDLGPDQQVAVIFDKGSRSFRNDMYQDYKANRVEPPEDLVPQFPLVREAAAAFSLPVLEIDDYEADDLIATYARCARERGQGVLIVSSDKDLMQLIGPGIEMLDPMKQKPIGRDEVVARFGVGPELVTDALALAGDSSDNVPGVPGIGTKTAAQLLTEFGSLEGLLEKADTIRQPKRRQNLIDHSEQARLSKELVLLCMDAPLPLPLEELTLAPLDYPKLLEFVRGYGFKSLAQRVEQQAGAAAVAARAGAGTGQPEGEYAALGTIEELDRLLERAARTGSLALDCATTSIDVTRAGLIGVALAVEPGEAFYLPLAHVDEFGQRAPGQLEQGDVLARLVPVLRDPSILKIGHDLKFHLGVLARLGLEVRPYDDTMMLSYVIDGAQHGHGLDELARLHLDHAMTPNDAVRGSGRNQIRFDQVPLDKATAFGGERADLTLRLHRILKPRLAEERRTRVYETMERPLVAVIEAMERRGIRVEPAMLRALSADFTARMADLQDHAFRLAGRSFNLGSPKQLGEILFVEQGLAAGRKTRTGALATTAQVLEGLAAQGHELPATVLAWRQLQKLTGTYTDALIEEINPADGRVHTTYAMALTSTGRLSSNDPNLQNIPIRTEEGRKIRAAFVPEPGHRLLSADYSQIELRILAHIADIGTLKAAFADNADIHAITASEMFKVALDKMDPLLRRNAKTINYGIIYGIGAYGLSERLGIPFDEAKRYIAAYFEQYPGIRNYMERAKEDARSHGYVQTLFGRKCATPEIRSANPARRGYAERAAINAPIQGSAADVIKRAMIRIATALGRSNLGARMLLQVHDELVFEVPESEIEPAAAVVRGIMQGAADLDVPLTVDIGHGESWDAAH